MALKRASVDRRRFVIQHSTGTAAVGSQMLRQKRQLDDSCPRCKMPEDCYHVLICLAAKLAKQAAIVNFVSAMRRSRSNPDLLAGLTALVESALFSLPPVINPLWAPDIQEAVTNQYEVGSRATLMGFVCSKWSLMQAS